MSATKPPNLRPRPNGYIHLLFNFLACEVRSLSFTTWRMAELIADVIILGTRIGQVNLQMKNLKSLAFIRRKQMPNISSTIWQLR